MWTSALLACAQIGDRREIDPIVGPPPAVARPNLLVIVLDDVGAESWQRSATIPAPTWPATPNLDAIADAGVLFRNVWAQPTCSPARVAALTGRSPARTGAGSALAVPSDWHLAPGTPTLPDALADAGYATAAIGKWHLGETVSADVPLPDDHWGFDHTAGTIANLGPEGNPWTDPQLGYYHFLRHEDGEAAWVWDYATRVVADDATAWIAEAPRPWFAWVAFHAAHAPFQLPPPDLVDEPLALGAPDLAIYASMIEAMDTEIGRLLAEVPDDTVVVVVGDNGLPFTLVPPEYADRVKGSTFEGGIHVPLVIAGPGVAQGRESAALVSVIDLATTVAALGGTSIPGAEGVDLRPVLAEPDLPGPRAVSFAHGFNPNFDPGAPAPAFVARSHAARDVRYKLRRSEVFGVPQPDELYDLVADPGELTDLLRAPTPEAAAAAASLGAALDAEVAGTALR